MTAPSAQRSGKPFAAGQPAGTGGRIAPQVFQCDIDLQPAIRRYPDTWDLERNHPRLMAALYAAALAAGIGLSWVLPALGSY